MSSDRSVEEAAFQGQGGSLVRPQRAATDLVKMLQSRDREAAWSGLGEQRQTWWISCSPGTERQPGQASASSDRPGLRSCRLEFSLVRYQRCLASASPLCSSLEKLPAGLAGLSTLASISGALWNTDSSVKVLHWLAVLILQHLSPASATMSSQIRVELEIVLCSCTIHNLAT